MKKPDLKIVLSLVGIAGIVATAYAAHKGGEKVAEKKKEATEKEEEFGIKETMMCHIPTIALGAVTCGSIIASYKLSAREIAALSASAAYLTTNRDMLERKLRESIGDEKVDQIKDKLALKNIANAPKKGITNKKIVAEETGYGDHLIYDTYSGRMFRSSIEEVDKGIRAFKRDFEGYDGMDRSPVCYNDLFEYWGINQTDWGEQYGWNTNEDFFDNEITFITKLVKREDIGNYAIKGVDEDVYIISLYAIHFPSEDWIDD